MDAEPAKFMSTLISLAHLVRGMIKIPLWRTGTGEAVGR